MQMQSFSIPLAQHLIDIIYICLDEPRNDKDDTDLTLVPNDNATQQYPIAHLLKTQLK